MSMNVEAIPNPKKDKWVPWYFVLFFAVIALLDGIFVYLAVSTQTGLVTEHAYEKGLAYDALLEKAAQQPDIKQVFSYKDGVMRWALKTEDNAAIKNAVVEGQVIRPVQDGYDFNVTFKDQGGGIYEAKPSMPLPGLWEVELSVTWNNNQTFQTKQEFMVP